ncbi:Z1 domain-containing protein [Gammaproteobacteria bacterium]|nr:Z1 domain-containing protein [Gammaproteobacteria bacterium]
MIRDIRTIILEQTKSRRCAREEVAGQPLNKEMIKALAESTCEEFYDINASDFNAVKKYVIDKLNYDGERTIGEHISISDDSYKPWVNNRKKDVPLYYWNRYVDFLGKKYEFKVIQDTDDATDWVIDRLGDPLEEKFNKRGLVMGSVQMGKTLNYVGLVNKAADMGYKLIIILAGGTESLRKQTQERINEGFIDKRQSDDEEYNKKRPISYTNVAQDFNKLEKAMPSLDVTTTPIVLVCKKNASVLNNLLMDWVIKGHSLRSEQFPSGRERIGSEHSLLFIDDEADYASINTKDISKNSGDRTRINELIRLLLNRFDKRSYVAYTATPFANIFIDPQSNNNEWEDDDLFPKNFIHQLGRPSNYKGPASYFGDNEESNTSVITLSNEVGERMFDFINKDREEDIYEVTGMTENLKESIRHFFLVVAERSIRGQEIEHNSMMINFQYLTRLQNELYILVNQYVKELQRSITSYSKLPTNLALEDENISKLMKTFNGVFMRGSKYKNRSFDEILQSLDEARTIKVVKVHHRSDDNLDYDQHPKGLNVIAIGGFSLSRGLTLEGLSVSFLDRTTKASDTLLQMGRWFGYRDGYDDLCKIYIDFQSREYFSRINETLAELEAELRTMNQYSLTPVDFGLQVREHAGGLLITAKPKMRSAQISSINISFWGQKYQSTWIPNDPKKIVNNKKEVVKLVSNLDNSLYQESSEPNKYIWRNVSSDNVFSFLDNFQEPNRNDNKNILLRDFLKEMRNELGELSLWTVQLISNATQSEKAGRIRGKNFVGVDINDQITVFSGLRKFLPPAADSKDSLKISGSQIGDADIDIKILTKEEHIKYKEMNNDVDSAPVARTALKNPVLYLFPIIPYYKGTNGDDDKLVFEETDDVFMFNVSIPRLMSDGSHPVKCDKKYALNTTKINIYQKALAEHEDQKLDEVSEEEPDE